MKMTIGFIGLGKMGTPMTKKLIEAHYKVNIYDKNPATLRSLIGPRAKRQNSIKDVGKFSSCIFIMVYPPKRAFNVIFERNKGLLAGIRASNNKNRQHTVIIDGGNADYTKSMDIGQRLSKEGIRYMDIGFSGGPSEAEKGNLAAFVGGTRGDFTRIRPLLGILCNKNRINYVGEIGSGHFAKVIAHNTAEYGIMGVIGEIASLSNEIGDHKSIMRAVNSGLAKTRLGALYLRLQNKEIENTGCNIGVTQNAAKLALREARRHRIGMPMITTIYYLRKISEELYKSNRIKQITKNRMIQDLLSQLDMLSNEEMKKGTVRSMAIQAQLRKVFGGHRVFDRKKPDPKCS